MQNRTLIGVAAVVVIVIAAFLIFRNVSGGVPKPSSDAVQMPDRAERD